MNINQAQIPVLPVIPAQAGIGQGLPDPAQPANVPEAPAQGGNPGIPNVQGWAPLNPVAIQNGAPPAA
ncbi:MAG: hypothetical protein ACI9BD_000522 [Candidatus Marinamargulisbacteria bacterium]|jgi:hypothetical protein